MAVHYENYPFYKVPMTYFNHSCVCKPKYNCLALTSNPIFSHILFLDPTILFQCVKLSAVLESLNHTFWITHKLFIMATGNTKLDVTAQYSQDVNRQGYREAQIGCILKIPFCYLNVPFEISLKFQMQNVEAEAVLPLPTLYTMLNFCHMIFQTTFYSTIHIFISDCQVAIYR